MPFPLVSARSDDGGARLSVKVLIMELETGMRSKGGNYMNITGMNLGIVRTLLNHMNRLEDRIDFLEGMLGSEGPPRKRAKTHGTNARDPM